MAETRSGTFWNLAREAIIKMDDSVVINIILPREYLVPKCPFPEKSTFFW